MTRLGKWWYRKRYEICPDHPDATIDNLNGCGLCNHEKYMAEKRKIDDRRNMLKQALLPKSAMPPPPPGPPLLVHDCVTTNCRNKVLVTPGIIGSPFCPRCKVKYAKSDGDDFRQIVKDAANQGREEYVHSEC